MNRHRIATWLTRALAGVVLLSWSGDVVSTRQEPAQATNRGVLTAVHFDVSAPLPQLALEAPTPGVGQMVRENPDPPAGAEGPMGPQDIDALVQGAVGTGELPVPIANFDTLNNTSGVTPPNPVGDVGPNHYVTMSNVSYAVFSKTGAVLAGPSLNNTLWAGFGGACQNQNAGNPIVLYDQFSDRWLLTQFTGDGPNYFLCVALSTTGDPTGTYFRWAFPTGTNFPDSPKFAVWHNAFFASTREFAGAGPFAGVGAYAFNRAQMLVGNPMPTVISFLAAPGVGGVTAFGVGDGLLPADPDGSLPPTFTLPAFFLGSQDDGGLYGAPSDAINVWKFAANFAFPGSSTFSLTNTIAVSPFDSMFPCTPGSRDCIAQRNTAQKLDHQGYRQRFLHRAAFRNFGTHQSIVVNQSVEAAANVSGIRWYELRSPNSAPFVFQQGTYAPGTTDNLQRWFGSMAMDQKGNMALGFSVSSATLFPGIRYTGRLAADPLGTLPQGERVFANGTGSQTGSSRWGEYTSMNVDPTDDCTFWYTNQYIPTTSVNGWRMRVGSFTYPDCPAPTGTYMQGDNNTATTIPGLTTIESPINISNFRGTLGEVRVSFHVTHTFDANLDISLVGPGGTTVELTSDNGGAADDYGTSCSPQTSRTTFADEAGTSITAGLAPFVGVFGPEQLLSAFNGTRGAAVNGTWKLRITNDGRFFVGVLSCWSLFLEPSFDNNSSMEIPTVGTIDSPIFVAGINRPISRVRVSMYITHQFDFNLDISLIGPDGTTVDLSRFNGGTGNNYGSTCAPQNSRTTFSDRGATSITAGVAPFVGTFRPEQALSAFRGKSGFNLNDTWTLRVTNGGFGGTLHCWSLLLETPTQSNFDTDGDVSSEIGIYRPSTGEWFLRKSSTNFTSFDSYSWGTGTDLPVPGDFDGDGKSDVAIYRPSTGEWFVLKSSSNFTTFDTYAWGTSTDRPVPGDYDGDGITDVAIYRPSTGFWFVLKSSGFRAFDSYSWGNSTDVPVPGDYDGDGTTDVAIYRPSAGSWFVLKSSSNFTTFSSHAWGAAMDVPVRGDFDGDGRTDVTVYRPSTGEWFVLRSGSNFTTFFTRVWGSPSDVPVSGDYDGDGTSDITIFRPSTGEWFVLRSSTGFSTFVSFVWGASSDVPLPR